MNDQANFAESTPQTQSPVSSPAPAAAPAPVVSHETTSEKMLSQSEVNTLIGRAKADERERVRREATQTPNQPMQANQAPQQSQSQMGGVTQLTPQEIQRQIDERVSQQLTQHQQQAQNYHAAQTFLNKLEAGKTKYSDFKEVVTDGFLQNFASNAPVVFHMANGFDNTDDLVYELRKNPGNIIKLRDLAQLDPSLANEELKKLSDSIKQNRSVSNQRSASEPLDQVKPSSTGMDNGSRTVRDYKRDPRYRV
jgi:hypothetical protein